MRHVYCVFNRVQQRVFRGARVVGAGATGASHWTHQQPSPRGRVSGSSAQSNYQFFGDEIVEPMTRIS